MGMAKHQNSRRFVALGLTATFMIPLWAAILTVFMTLGLWQGKSETLVEKTAISLSGHPSHAEEEHGDHAQGTGVCEHHPQGCPKDCFCPKIYEETSPSSSSTSPSVQSKSMDWMTGPLLVQCTSDKKMVVQAALLLGAPPAIVDGWMDIGWIALLSDLPVLPVAGPYLHSPQKIPIG
jgi:hypothetical protein